MDGEELGLIEDEPGTGEESGGDEGGGEEEVIEGEGEGGEAEGGEGGEGGEDFSDEERSRAGTRTLPTELRKALREFNAGNPDFAKRHPQLERQLTAALYKAGQADRMGGLQQLRAARELLESHGGPDRIAAMAEEAEAARSLQEGMRDGDPVLIDIWSKQHPEGFKASVGPSIDRLEQMDLPAHDRALSGPMYRTLSRCGVLASMNDLETAIAGERYEDIQKHHAAIKQFLKDLDNFSRQAKAPDPLKADRERIEQERAENQRERRETFRSGVATEVGMATISQINRALRVELSGRKLSVGTANRLRKQINEDLAAAVNGNEQYREKYKAIMGTGDHQRAVQFIVQNSRQKIPLIVKRVLRDFNVTGKAAPAGGRRIARVREGGGGGNNTVNGRPKTMDVDFTRTDKARYLGSLSGHGEAYLRNGKLAKW